MRADWLRLREFVRDMHLPPYVVRDDAPATYVDISRTYRETGRLVVWSGGSARTIFLFPQLNWRFRAWHDWTHIRFNNDFTLDGERQTAHEQIRDMHYEGVHGLARVIWREVVEMAEYKAVHGHFPVDQIAFHLSSE